jgi:hypothetical protein
MMLSLDFGGAGEEAELLQGREGIEGYSLACDLP